MPIKFSIHQGMLSGKYEAQVREYNQYRGKSGRFWYVPTQPNAANNIYVSDPNPRSQGFGGATITFRLVSGIEVREQGPWHSNADALYDDTGIDLRNTYLTQGIVAETRVNSWPHDFYVGVLHVDQEPILGSYSRIRDIAQMWADHLQKNIYYAYRGPGGGCSCRCEPGSS